MAYIKPPQYPSCMQAAIAHVSCLLCAAKVRSRFASHPTHAGHGHHSKQPQALGCASTTSCEQCWLMSIPPSNSVSPATIQASCHAASPRKHTPPLAAKQQHIQVRLRLYLTAGMRPCLGLHVGLHRKPPCSTHTHDDVDSQFTGLKLLCVPF